MSFLSSLSMITKVSLITPRSLWPLKISLAVALGLEKYKVQLNNYKMKQKVCKLLTSSPLFPAAPGGPTGPLEPWEKWIKSTGDLLGVFYSRVPAWPHFWRSHQISVRAVLTDLTIRIKTSAYNVTSPSRTTRWTNRTCRAWKSLGTNQSLWTRISSVALAKQTTQS